MKLFHLPSHQILVNNKHSYLILTTMKVEWKDFKVTKNYQKFHNLAVCCWSESKSYKQQFDSHQQRLKFVACNF